MVFTVSHGISLIVASRGYSSLQYMGFWLRWLLLSWSLGSRSVGFSSSVCGLSCSEACGIFPDQALNLCPLYYKVILYHWTTREAQGYILRYWGVRTSTYEFVGNTIQSIAPSLSHFPTPQLVFPDEANHQQAEGTHLCTGSAGQGGETGKQS